MKVNINMILSEQPILSMTRSDVSTAILTVGFCIGAIKYISLRREKKMSTLETVFSGYMNAMILSAISVMVPEKLKPAILLIDLGCLSFNLYSRRKNRASRLPDYDTRSDTPSEKRATVPDEEFEENNSID